MSNFSGTARWQNRDDRFGAGLKLTGINVAENVPACGKVGIALMWHADRNVATDYTLSVTLLDRLGDRIGQEDGPPVGEGRPTSRWKTGETATGTRWITVPSTIPPGEYRIVLSWYDDDERVLANAQGVERIEVGTMSIVPCVAS